MPSPNCSSCSYCKPITSNDLDAAAGIVGVGLGLFFLGLAAGIITEAGAAAGITTIEKFLFGGWSIAFGAITLPLGAYVFIRSEIERRKKRKADNKPKLTHDNEP